MIPEFLYPEKPQRVYDANRVPEHYKVQVKKNGWRIILTSQKPGSITLYNRHGRKISTAQEFDWTWITKILPSPFILDGEVVGPRQKSMKSDTIVIWDAAYLDGKDLTKRTQQDRWEMLNAYACQLPPERNVKNYGARLIGESGKTQLYLSETYPYSQYYKIWEELDRDFDEGLVFKNFQSPLSWNRFKTKENISQLKLLRPEVNPQSINYNK